MGALGIGTDSRLACGILEPGQPNSSPETTLVRLFDVDPGFEGACVCCAVFRGVSSQLKKSLTLDRDLSLLELSIIFYESPL
jgi:hypothetical protein